MKGIRGKIRITVGSTSVSDIHNQVTDILTASYRIICRKKHGLYILSILKFLQGETLEVHCKAMVKK